LHVWKRNHYRSGERICIVVSSIMIRAPETFQSNLSKITLERCCACRKMSTVTIQLAPQRAFPIFGLCASQTFTVSFARLRNPQLYLFELPFDSIIRSFSMWVNERTKNVVIPSPQWSKSLSHPRAPTA
jgi:hypothetical protein